VESRKTKERRKSREQRHRDTERHKRRGASLKFTKKINTDRGDKNTDRGEPQFREGFPPSFVRVWVHGRLRPAASEAPAAKINTVKLPGR
jgi:hypothetical protein